MPLNPSAVGSKSSPVEFKYTWKDVALYALGVGAKKDELDYVYEARGPKVIPTFAVVPSFMPMAEVLSATGGNFANILHGGETVRVHRAIPSEGTATTVATLSAMYDLRKMAQVIVKTETTIGGHLVFETEASIIYRGEGGFDGAAPPRADTPSAPEGAEPTWTHSEATLPEQALLYRLSGDLNPLHADPAFATMLGFPAPILHGLCTYGFVCRAVAQKACGGDATRIKAFGAQFRKPVWPGETLKTVGWDLGGGKVAVKVYAADRPEAVITNCWAEIG